MVQETVDIYRYEVIHGMHNRQIENLLIVDNDSFWVPPEVEYLSLKRAGLVHISPSIAALEHLKKLDLSYNKIRTLPRMQSAGLETLYVDSRSV